MYYKNAKTIEKARNAIFIPRVSSYDITNTEALSLIIFEISERFPLCGAVKKNRPPIKQKILYITTFKMNATN